MIVAIGSAVVFSAREYYTFGHLTGRQRVTWGVVDSTVATVSGMGRVLGTSIGATTITAAIGDETGTAWIEVMSPDRLPSLSRDVQPIFTNSCALSGCHTGANPPFRLPLDEGRAYDHLVNVPAVELEMSRVTPFEPRRSYLLFELQGEGRAPRGGVPHAHQDVHVPESHLEAIRAWIRAGAPNN